MPRKILVASYTSHITTLSFDTTVSPPTLSVVSSLETGHHPSWIAPHRTDASVVFIVNEKADGVVKALKYDLSTGKGKVIAEASSGGADPCHLAVSGDDLITANYAGGTVGILPLSSSAPYLPSEPSQTISFTGSGPIASRQEASHPHQVLVHPTRKEVLVPDLGVDRIWRLEKSKSGWVVKGQMKTQPGGGPRHGVILGETLYTVLELSNTLTSHILPPLPEQAVALDAAFTLSDPPKNPNTIDPPPVCAELLSTAVSTAFSTPYLYVTNRNDPSPEGDILSIFETGDAGSIRLTKEVRTGLNHLRGVALDEDGRYLIAGGTFGGGVKMFELVDGGKDLKEIAHLKDVEKPTGFHWLPTA